jgi:hypothetical protein
MISGNIASVTPLLHYPPFLVISEIMNKFVTNQDSHYTLSRVLPNLTFACCLLFQLSERRPQKYLR